MRRQGEPNRRTGLPRLQSNHGKGGPPKSPAVRKGEARTPGRRSARDVGGLDELLEFLKQERGFDFGGYKRTTIVRRIQKRMADVGLRSYDSYVDYLQVHPDEYTHLFNTVLINVTSFFRDETTWDYVRDDVLPRILAAKGANDPIRIWSAGCSSGEEAYSIAMLLAEVLEIPAFNQRVKVYATDIDEDVLARARAASYAPRDLTGVPPHLVDKYFTSQGRAYSVVKELRRAVIFGRHDLMQDAPISKVDLLLCRNTLMYFAAEAQSRVLERLHFALNPKGVLFVGKAEMLLTHSDLFTPLDVKRRLFLPQRRATGDGLGSRLKFGERLAFPLATAGGLGEALFEVAPLAQVLLDPQGIVLFANEHARAMFALGARDIGSRLQDLSLSYRPVELRSKVEEALATQRSVELRDIEWRSDQGEPQCCDVFVVPRFHEGQPVGVLLAFEDVTRFRDLQHELRRSAQELEAAYEELQSTSEELETTNEELQSTNEELETTNEELQSTNEELETMNEELQSTNEELQTMNQELRERGDELNRINTLFGAVLASMRGAIIVVNKELEVQVWNHGAEDLWGLRADEVLGKNLLNLEVGFPLERLRSRIHTCLAGGAADELVAPAVNRRGQRLECQTTITPLSTGTLTGQIWGVILLMVNRSDRTSRFPRRRRHAEKARP